MSERRSIGPAKPETRETRHPDRPEPGFYAYRHVSKGPRVGARIFRPCCCGINGGDVNREHDWRDGCDRHAPLVCEVDGRRYDDPIDRTKVPMIERVWLYGDRVSEAEYRYLVAGAAWDRVNQPDAPAANPTKPVNLNELDPIW